MAQKTAVEWLWRWQMDNPFASFKEGVDAYKRAKAMEKSQMEELALYIYEYSVTCLEERINPDGKKKFEQYYSQTYNNKI